MAEGTAITAVITEKANYTTVAEGFLQSILQGRGQTADEIAAAALFLVSEQATAIVGQSINVDGGGVGYPRNHPEFVS